jgi:hypothetical protein
MFVLFLFRHCDMYVYDAVVKVLNMIIVAPFVYPTFNYYRTVYLTINLAGGALSFDGRTNDTADPATF